MVTQVSKRELYFILTALMLGMLLAALDSTIVSTALPTIVGDLNGASHIGWVVVAYLLASTVSTPLWGKLGDLHGRKNYFQAAIVLFIAGSVACGFAHSILQLIIFRAFQGLGGGGLMIGAQSVIADVVEPKDRGRYSGLFGAVFGAATVLGPLLGGVIVDHWSWRWIFFVNVPFGIIAFLVTASALPADRDRVSHVIDYLGVGLLVVASTSLILFTSLGGSTFAWSSWKSIALLVTGLVVSVIFVFVERRAQEPVLSPKLFANRVFRSASAIGFVVGFAMFGAMTFLPLFLQEVRGVSPTTSGLRLLPMMVGLFSMSILVGQLVSRGRKYRPFPIIGTAVMTIGLGLLGTMSETTSTLLMSVYMFILGAGLGLVMQVLVTAVQNAVSPSDVGVATAGANFFRSIGGSFGTAVFSAIYANELPHQLAKNLRGVTLPSGFSFKPSTWTPALLHRLPVTVLVPILHSIAVSIQTLFRYAAPVGLVALVLSLTLPELKFRTSSHPVADEVPLSNTELDL